MLNQVLGKECRAKLMVSSSADENCKICKNQGFLIASFILFLLINISFLSAQTYTLKVTDEHPFYLDNEWVVAKDLKVGDLLLTDEGNKAKIISIKEIYENVDVYNLHVDGLNDYYAGNVLVHNKNPPEPGVGWGGPRTLPEAEATQVRAAKSALDGLAWRVPGIQKNIEGTVRDVFLIDLSQVPANRLNDIPEIIRKIAGRINRPFVLKFFKEEIPLAEIEFEINSRNCLSCRNLFPEMYYSNNRPHTICFHGRRISVVSRGDFTIDGMINENSIRNNRQYFLDYRAELRNSGRDAEAEQVTRIVEEIDRRLRDNILPGIISCFVRRGLLWQDSTPSNIAIGFRHATTKQPLNFRNDVLSRRVPIEQVEVYYRIYELGGVIESSSSEGVAYSEGFELYPLDTLDE